MLTRKYYKYKEVAKQLDCSYDDMEDYIYRQYLVRPCINYSGYAVDSSHQSGSIPKLIKLNGDYEVDLSSLSTTRTIITGVGFEDSNDHFITRLYHEDRLVKLVRILKNTHSSEYGFSNVINDKVRFAYQPDELFFLKDTIDKLSHEFNSEIPVPTTPTEKTQSNCVVDEIENCKQIVKAQGFASRKQLSIITGKAIQTLANKVTTHPNTSGYDKTHKHYPLDAIKKFYDIDFF